ncbi:hypothetical protein HMPREF0083_03488 [Aneurinibacillus aneurinilyticus ATCC 12856]|uniref:Transmembrane protein n=1 Tax=Aneurinibacillus aneurinilyticus ATCC 12856 TaxID=649747 RepID=U1WIM7_ANEAE|nr:hypothetical protein HMPREF0083_03488 [Aneurinibacillus aneurinilyticus ATCC 12856]
MGESEKEEVGCALRSNRRRVKAALCFGPMSLYLVSDFLFLFLLPTTGSCVFIKPDVDG